MTRGQHLEMIKKMVFTEEEWIQFRQAIATGDINVIYSHIKDKSYDRFMVLVDNDVEVKNED